MDERQPNGPGVFAAMRRLAEIAAAGHDWRVALDELDRAAAAGDAVAAADRAALGIAAASGPADIAQLLAVPQMKVISASPRIALIPDFASPAMCERLIHCARPKLAPAKIYDLESGEGRTLPVRNNSECHLVAGDGVVPVLIRARIARATELPTTAMEATAILHYMPGQSFEPHCDFLDPTHPGHKRQIAKSGQRVLTFLLSLNDGYDGGETEFPLLGKRYKGKRGTAIFFWNVEPNGAPDRRTVHAGLAPTAGEKWMLSQWVRDRNWREPFSSSP